MPHVKLPATIIELERQLKHAIAMAEQPKFPQTRHIYWQVHARTIQARIEVLEAMQANPSNIRKEFEELEQRRLEGFGT